MLALFHPVVRTWFERRFASPTGAQVEGWPHIHANEPTLIAAPTGSGKTLAAFLVGIDQLVREAEAGDLTAATRIVYVSPLKALSNDIQRNLEEPLAEISALAVEMGYQLPPITSAVRTGDTPSSARQTMVRRPPHILVTTPESLFLLVTAERSRENLRDVRTVIVDEVHALARDRRGSHLALTLARLEDLTETPIVRIGLSATQNPIELMARFFASPGRPATIVDQGHQRDIELHVETPPSDLEAVPAREQWRDIFDRLAELISEHRTTLIFVNTRSLSERVAKELTERLGEEAVASHHGSIAKGRRLYVEQCLKAGELRALVATASLELGIDIGAIDLVCQVGSPRSIATLLQRIGRSGHALGLRPHGRLFPTTRDELIECAALVRAVRAGRLDRISPLTAPLDVLAQQIVAECACKPWSEDALYSLMREAYPFAELSREYFDEIVTMLATGIGDGPGGSSPLIHRDRVNGMVRGRRGARLAALNNGGVIPEMGDYRVIAEPEDIPVGTVNEDFALESAAGDIFLLGSTSWRITRVERSTVRVVDAHGAPPTVPFWLGEAPGRTIELSEEAGRLRREIADGFGDPSTLVTRLQEECSLCENGARQMVDYVLATRDGLGVVPSDTDVVFERFFDDSGGMQLVIHAPFGARVNRAWGLALRKQFCTTFDFELQAAANDDAILLSSGPQHSWPLAEAFTWVNPRNAATLVEKSIFYIPLFPTRWRWNASRALAIARQRNGKRVPPFLQRIRGDDLMAAVFPAQVGCQEHLDAPLSLPNHPLMRQTRDDCLYEAMDVCGLQNVLTRIEEGHVRLHAVDSVEPSPMAHEIVNGRPYTFLDDAPIEERRTRAVTLRRTLPDSARDLATLSPVAIARVCEEARPDPRNREEVHDTLLGLVALSEEYAASWHKWLAELEAAKRVARFRVGNRSVWFAVENLPSIQALFPEAEVPSPGVPSHALIGVKDREGARLALVRGHTECLGPLTPIDISKRTGLAEKDVDYGLRAAEAEGHLVRGRFTPSISEDELCDRRLLARIHRYTLQGLRKAVSPVSSADYMRFLTRWHGLAPGAVYGGRPGLRRALERLQGFEAPAGSWENELIRSRVSDYDPVWLDELCFAGEIAWARLSIRKPQNSSPVLNRVAPATRATPITLVPRHSLSDLLAAVRYDRQGAVVPLAGSAAAIVELLRERGALFFEELVRETGQLMSQTEEALRELIAVGLVASDGFEGVRKIFAPPSSGRRRIAIRRPKASYRLGLVLGGPPGRWSLIEAGPTDSLQRDELAAIVASVLLERYGVVFRDLAAQERFAIPWREILRALRGMEARGDVRGGRFVSGVNGEQYALINAVEQLRATRMDPPRGERVVISAVDPVNLTGTVLPEPRVASHTGRSLVLLDGVLEDVKAVGTFAPVTGP
ncbi:MAG: hypothetical protein CL897_00350 [Dehalococcoidia bacterium]|nr:hypothetical protein [Dehalococcoidia bacterium]